MAVHSVNLKDLHNALAEKLRREDYVNLAQLLKQPGGDVGPGERDKTVQWLFWSTDEFDFHPRTYALAVSIFDQFLGIVKVSQRYLKCAALTSLYIATKLVEEDEFIPSTLRLIKAADSKFGPNDMIRMERIILTKLGWDLGKPTSYDFLELFISLLYVNVKDLFDVRGILPEMLVGELWNQLQDCLNQCKFSRFRGSTLALALVSCALERLHPSWFSLVNAYQVQGQVPVKEFLKCREWIKALFAISRHPKTPKKRSVLRRPRLSPIPENPFEAEFLAFSMKRPGGDRSEIQRSNRSRVRAQFQGIREVSPSTDLAEREIEDQDVLREELKRLQKISVHDDMSLPAAKRPRIHPHGVVACC